MWPCMTLPSPELIRGPKRNLTVSRMLLLEQVLSPPSHGFSCIQFGRQWQPTLSRVSYSAGTELLDRIFSYIRADGQYSPFPNCTLVLTLGVCWLVKLHPLSAHTHHSCIITTDLIMTPSAIMSTHSTLFIHWVQLTFDNRSDPQSHPS